MKETQMLLLNARNLGAKEMRQVKGGIIYRFWECVIGYDCFPTQAGCLAECTRLNGCRRTQVCR